EILAEYPDPEFPTRLRKLTALRDFLQRCIVDDGYDVPAKLTAAIRLTQSGYDLVTKLQRQHGRNEAITAVLLETWWTDLFVDPLASDLDALKSVISDEIQRRNIVLPYVYGRILYDKAYEEVPDSRDFVSVRDTFVLLTDTPQGVFQSEEYVSGPYGLL